MMKTLLSIVSVLWGAFLSVSTLTQTPSQTMVPESLSTFLMGLVFIVVGGYFIFDDDVYPKNRR